MIAGEIFLREHNEYHDVFTLYSQITKTEFTDILEIHTLELPKVPAEADGSELWTWLEFIKAESEEELKMLVKKEPKMKAAAERLLAINRDPATRALYEAREKEQRDSRARVRLAMQRGIAEGLEKGMEKGMEKGIAEGRLAIARNMIEDRETVDKIMKYTGLSLEEIENITNEQ